MKMNLVVIPISEKTWVGGIAMWKWEAEGQPKAVVVIIHSAFEQHKWYAWLIEKLRIEGYHIVMGDLPGHGEQAKFSRVHDETIIDYLLYLKRLYQNALTYELPVFVIGHGLGGTLAIEFLKKNKIECAGVILTSPWLYLKKQKNFFTNAVTTLGKITPKRKISLHFDKKMLTRSLDGYQEINDDIPYHSNVTVRWYRDVHQLMKNITSQQESILSIPILVLTTQQDKITEIKTTRKWLLQQNSAEIQYKEWLHGYHNLFHDNERQLVFLYVKDFINNVNRSLGYIVE